MIGRHDFNTLTTSERAGLAYSISAAHTHSNKTALDESTASYTTAEKTKLGNLTDSFKGVYATSAALLSAYTSPSAGWSAWVTGTATMWIVSSGAWANSNVSSVGNMLQSVYDPQSIGADAFSRGNHTGTQEISTIANLGSASVDTSGNVSLPAGLAVNGNVSGALVSSSGLSASTYGLYLSSAVPADTSYRLYNNGGTLMFNGNALAMGSSVSGSANYLSKFTGSNSLGDSGIYEDSSGNVGIGNIEPDALITIGNTTDTHGYIRLKGTTIGEGNIYHEDAYGLRLDTSMNTLPIRIDGSKLVLGMVGYVGIGKEDPAFPLHVEGSADYVGTSAYGYLSASGAGTGNGFTANCAIYTPNRVVCGELDAVSDRRAKKNIVAINEADALAMVNKIEASSFEWKDGCGDKGPKLGWIAQDVGAAGLGEAVTVRNGKIVDDDGNLVEVDDFHTINPTVLCAVLWAAVRKLSAKVSELESKIA